MSILVGGCVYGLIVLLLGFFYDTIVGGDLLWNPPLKMVDYLMIYLIYPVI